mmetsp:Transcript_62643/g.149421  ORF Transcript_62643/g.149421 Transcript_62643/m.149421 type:complete len:485 (-) Transcript_62643:79-1533(-)
MKRRGRAESPAPAEREGRGQAAKGADDKEDSQKKPVLEEIKNRKMHVVETLGTASLVMITPLVCLTLAFITCSPSLASPTIGSFIAYASKQGFLKTATSIWSLTGFGSVAAWKFLLAFNGVALALYWLPGKTKTGPITPTGHTPSYVDNGIAHCALFTLAFATAGMGLKLFPPGIMFDVFPGTLGALNTFGLLFCLFLYVKGLRFPSTKDCGSSGNGFLFDYYWGTELYPRIAGVDVKKFVNCRFSMTFWMLAGLSFACKSYEIHGYTDPGIVLSALSQFLYLCKFFAWEIGYMRSIDIIVDRAGFYETWGCLTFVPALYTLHTRILVLSPSGLSWPVAVIIFAVGLSGVFLNYWADAQRMRFREKEGNCLVWGKKPEFIRAKYSALNEKTGKIETHESLLLASGWWGVARHFQYAFELTAAWSWGLLGGVMTNGCLSLFYPIFLTILLIHRAGRDEEKCLAKYGEYYKEYMKVVRYRIIPYVY